MAFTTGGILLGRFVARYFQYDEHLDECCQPPTPHRKGGAVFDPIRGERHAGVQLKSLRPTFISHLNSQLSYERKTSSYIPNVTGAGVRGVVGDRVATVTGAGVDSGAAAFEIESAKWDQVGRSAG